MRYFLSLFLCILLLSSGAGTSFFATAGPNYPGTADGNVSGAGSQAWATSSSALTDDGSFATITANAPGPDTISKYLKLTNYGFSLPAATINGVTVEIKRKTTFSDFGAGVFAYDNSVRLVKGGTISGSDYAVGIPTIWPSSPTYATYGGSSDLWGLSLTASDVNSSTFGMVIAVQMVSDGVNTAYVDTARMTITYTAIVHNGDGFFMNCCPMQQTQTRAATLAQVGQ